MIAENPYAPIPARLSDVIQETPTIKTFVLAPEQPIEFRAGQFVQITMPGLGEAPFTPSSDPKETDRLAVTVLKTGEVTDALHEVSPDQMLGIRGPFGKGYPLDKLEGKQVLVVGGGVGMAPLRALLYTLFDQLDRVERLSVKYGARTPDELLFSKEFDTWAGKPKVDVTITIDVPAPGWTGRVGLVTTLLDDLDLDIPNCIAFSCGPGIMLRFVTFTLIEKGFQPNQIYLSMNRRMSCGIGKCGRCNIGPYYLCKDGPDMCYEEIKDYANVL